MPKPGSSSTTGPGLSRDRVLNAAVSVADRVGIAGLTMRSLAQELGAKPMSVYHHVANKEEILDGIVDRSIFLQWAPRGARKSAGARSQRVGC